MYDDASGTSTNANRATVDWNGSVAVTYTYDAAPPPPTTDAPEPASLALLASALAGTALLRRHRG